MLIILLCVILFFIILKNSGSEEGHPKRIEPKRSNRLSMRKSTDVSITDELNKISNFTTISKEDTADENVEVDIEDIDETVANATETTEERNIDQVRAKKS